VLGKLLPACCHLGTLNQLFVWPCSLERTETVQGVQRSLVSEFFGSSLSCSCVYCLTRLECKETLLVREACVTESVLKNDLLFFYLQYAFLVTASVQFAGGVIVFFGLLTSPKEVGE